MNPATSPRTIHPIIDMLVTLLSVQIRRDKKDILTAQRLNVRDRLLFRAGDVWELLDVIAAHTVCRMMAAAMTG
jgi:hypothetical protein